MTSGINAVHQQSPESLNWQNRRNGRWRSSGQIWSVLDFGISGKSLASFASFAVKGLSAVNRLLRPVLHFPCYGEKEELKEESLSQHSSRCREVGLKKEEGASQKESREEAGCKNRKEKICGKEGRACEIGKSEDENRLHSICHREDEADCRGAKG
ncbi:MAG TPA: hypothetical protein VHN74_04495 [Candidatus Angelobacter sp.]|nr:hypothetical protein [Candidatus Angelobacter sp.]